MTKKDSGEPIESGAKKAKHDVLNTEVKRNRYWHIQQLIRAHGGTNEVARIMGKYNSYLTQCGSENPSRAIGNKIAGQIEKAFLLPPGSLDQPPPESALESGIIGEISAVLTGAAEREQSLVLEITKVIVKHGGTYLRSNDV